MMDNLDLGQYMADRPGVSRLELVCTILARRDLTCIELHAQLGHHAWEHQDGMSSLFLLRRYGPLTLFKRNVSVDGNGVARLGGLGSAFSLSLPASWSDAGAERLFCGIAPELINPQAFGLVHARTTKVTDMFAFGMLAWEVS